MSRRLNSSTNTPTPSNTSINYDPIDPIDHNSLNSLNIDAVVDVDMPEFTPPQTASVYDKPLSAQEMHEISQLSKADIFKRLNKSLPSNEYELPDYIYRSDLIPSDIYYRTVSDRNDILTSAIIPITWDHGYPATDDATPLWERLPGEPTEAYDVYLKYLELPQTSNSANPVRMLPLLASLTGLPYEKLSEYSHVFYWRVRFRAYDLFLVACHQKQREQRIMSIEGRHFSLAEKYLNKIDAILEARLQHDIEELTASGEGGESSLHYDLKLKDIVDMVQKLTTIQRVAVGLPANGNDTSDRTRLGANNQSIDDAFREIASHATPSKRANDRPVSMDALLADPEALAKAQDLILRTSK